MASLADARWRLPLLAIVLAGCGGVTAATPDAGGGAGTGGDAAAEAPPLTAEEGCNQVAEALCNAIEACAPTALKVFYGDEATCVARAALGCTTDQKVPGIKRTPTDLVACKQALTTATCAALLANEYPEACNTKPGETINGAACGSDWQCTSSFCKKTGECGVCAPRADVNGDCAADHGCVQGLVCANKKCVAPAAMGADCNLPNQPCRSGLYCTAMSGKCAAKLGAGGPCVDSDQACDFAKGVVCNGVSKVCETVTVAKGGEACGLGIRAICVGFVEPCSNIITGGVCANPAQDGEACGGTKKCVPPATCEAGICRLPSAPSCQ
jgi:hypothetical protein